MDDMDCSVIDHFSVPASHPCLKGHFPDYPVVPAVLILEMIMRLSQDTWAKSRVVEFKQVKFLKPLEPEKVLEVCLKRDRKYISFEGFINDEKSLTGIALLATGDKS